MENLRTFEEFGFWRKLVDPTGKVFGEEKPKPAKDPDDRPFFKKFIDPTGELFGGKKAPVRQQRPADIPTKPIEIPKTGDILIYNNPDSTHDGETGKFVRVREDGKWSVLFDSGTQFAGNKVNFKIIPTPKVSSHSNIDPYGDDGDVIE